VGKVQEIEKIRNLIEKEASKEFPDKKLLEKLNHTLILVGIGLTFSDINPPFKMRP
jgi:hypothetical protein